MSMDIVRAVLSNALPGRFVAVAFDEECGGCGIAWGYLDRQNAEHYGMAIDFRAAVASAGLWGFVLNGNQNETPVAANQHDRGLHHNSKGRAT